MDKLIRYLNGGKANVHVELEFIDNQEQSFSEKRQYMLSNKVFIAIPPRAKKIRIHDTNFTNEGLIEELNPIFLSHSLCRAFFYQVLSDRKDSTAFNPSDLIDAFPCRSIGLAEPIPKEGAILEIEAQIRPKLKLTNWRIS